MSKTITRRVDVSFLILNYNGKKVTKILLDSINKIKFSGSYEIVIVDNASTDGSVDFFREKYPKAELVVNKVNCGTSGINPGLRKCKAELIFYLNNDIELDPSCLQKLYDVIVKDKKIGLVSPRHINYYDRKMQSAGFWISRSFYGGHYTAKKIDKTVKEIPYAGVFLFRKEITDKLGCLFDPDYFIYSEDLDFSLRSRLIGYKVMFVPDAIIYHMHAATIGKQDTSQLTFFIERNILSTFFKVFKARTILLMLPYVVLMRIIALIKDFFTLNFKNLFFRLKAFFWVLSNFGLILRKRKVLQQKRVVEDKEILRLFSEKYLFKKQPHV